MQKYSFYVESPNNWDRKHGNVTNGGLLTCSDYLDFLVLTLTMQTLNS